MPRRASLCDPEPRSRPDTPWFERFSVRSRTRPRHRSLNSIATNLGNPLWALPSVLAIRDLRRRFRRATTRPLDHAMIQQLLALDPLAVVRLLRATAAPVYAPLPGPWTIGALVQACGSALARRALDVPVVDVTGTAAVRKLWLHSLATAQAARAIARDAGLLDPEEAYLLGLLHDLPQWLHVLSLRQTGAPPDGSLSDWLRHWQLPAPLTARLLAAHAAAGLHDAPAGTAPLLESAALLAELAGFDPPHGIPAEERLLQLEGVDRAQWIAAQRLRRDVEQTLAAIGLDLALPEPDQEIGSAEFVPALDCLTAQPLPGTPDVVLSLLGCTRWTSYHSILTAGTAAALRHLGFDRACFATWCRGSGRIAIRTKTDLSNRRVHAREAMPTPAEAAALQAALDSERPVLLRRDRERAGILQHFAMDEAMAVPVNRTFGTPAFLLLDRTLSARPIDLPSESESATMLGMTLTLLNENLLLKRRQQRAAKFAVTDPLTRLFNRRQGVLTLDQELARAVRSDRPLTVLMLDLDDFKKINDTYGHLQGDAALRTTADVLRKTLRKSDTICRYGGEEFLVVLPETAAEDASILAARLFVAIEAAGADIGLPTTASIGLASARGTDSVESLLARADHALYASKSLGRNRFSVDVEPD